MATNFSTLGGVVTRGETFAKLLDHLREARDCAAVLSHLHNTEDSEMDKLLAKGWLGIAEMFRLAEHQIIEMAKTKLQ